MRPYAERSAEELTAELNDLTEKYVQYQRRGLQLNMARGIPCAQQLNLSMEMMDILTAGGDLHCEDGTDCRNYGLLGGIEEAKELLGSMIELPADNIIIFGNSSLNVMYDTISRAMTHGIMGSTPWSKLDKVKFLCPVPGYDRHFAITEYFGIEMINIPMDENGPDMDLVEHYVQTDESVKGIWCVPKYSNPSGITYSPETVQRFAHLKPAARDFRIFWDNAYCVHHLYPDKQDYLKEILTECKKAGNPDMVFKFVSTSKISFPGSGIAAIAASHNNLVDIRRQLSVQTIGHDKINQLMHVRFFKDLDGITNHMKKHADILRPKFELVQQIFNEELSGLGAGSWSNPRGGYFVSFDTVPGCAKRVVSRCKKAGVMLTPAGATYPYHNDPNDSNIRIAPSFPSLETLEQALRIFCLSVRIETVKQLLTKQV